MIHETPPVDPAQMMVTAKAHCTAAAKATLAGDSRATELALVAFAELDRARAALAAMPAPVSQPTDQALLGAGDA